MKQRHRFKPLCFSTYFVSLGLLPVTPNGYQWFIIVSPVLHRFPTYCSHIVTLHTPHEDLWPSMKHEAMECHGMPWNAMAHGTQPSQNLPMSLRPAQHGWVQVVRVAAAPPWILPSAKEKMPRTKQSEARYGEVWQDARGKNDKQWQTSSIRDNTPGPTMCDSISIVRKRLSTTAESTFIMEPLLN